MPKRGVSGLLLIYVGVLGTLAALCGVGYVKMTEASEGYRASPDKSLLDERMASVRRIKALLAKPQPTPEPLPPVTQKLANPPPIIAASVKPEKREAPKISLSTVARNSMAMAGRAETPARRPAPTYDRAGGGAW
jgi:hypothetical protein